MEKQTKRALKIVLSILLGSGLSVLSFIAFILLHFSPQMKILFPLLCVFYVSAIAFLVLWNTMNSKRAYAFLSVSVMCIAAGTAVLLYYDYIDKIPSVSEEGIYLYKYNPFREDNLLPQLDGESNFKISGNAPVLDGATALYPVYASFAQAVYPLNEYDLSQSPVLCSRTDGAYNNLFEGGADLIFCAGPSEAQLSRFIDNGIPVKFTAIGREAFVFFVNKKNPVSDLRMGDIRGIYSGRIKNWRELNGPHQRIRAFQRPENSGSQTMLKKVIGIPPMSPLRENVAADMGGIISQVAVYRNFSNAIGYSFLYFSTELVKNDSIKLLSIEGVPPTKATIRDGTYPFAENFYAVYIDDDGKNENIEPFIEWILSAQGQELIQKTGYVPLMGSGD